MANSGLTGFVGAGAVGGRLGGLLEWRGRLLSVRFVTARGSRLLGLGGLGGKVFDLLVELFEGFKRSEGFDPLDSAFDFLGTVLSVQEVVEAKVEISD